MIAGERNFDSKYKIPGTTVGEVYAPGAYSTVANFSEVIGWGGSAGGHGWYGQSSFIQRGMDGGSDGQSIEFKPIGCSFTIAKKGQGSTTRAFGESWGTLYAGGGGGGASTGNFISKDIWGCSGGAGGGGNGGSVDSNGNCTIGANGGYGTGGGGGGGSSSFFSTPNHTDGGNGGSGIAIIRWGY